MKTSNVRRPMFAGSWYPSSASDCEREITGFLAEGKKLKPPDRKLVGGIVPHAGWYYSGSIACNVISSLKSEIHRMLLWYLACTFIPIPIAI